jgi:uncharacterized membrane protein
MTNQACPNEVHGISFRMQLIFYILALSGCVALIVALLGGNLLQNIERLERGHIYVSVSNWDIPAFVSLPCFFALIVALTLRLVRAASEKRIQVCVKVAFGAALVAIMVRLPYGFVVSNYMGAHGYTSCWQYSSQSIMGPVVWVRNTGYCVENSGSVSRELLEWLDNNSNSDNEVTPDEVRLKIDELLKNWERERYSLLNR